MILINLLPHREAARKRRRETFQAIMVASALAGLAIAGLIYWWFQMQITDQQDKNNFLRGEIQVLEKQIKEIATIEEEIAALQARQKAVEDLQSDRNLPVHLLNELVKQLPDGVYVTSLKQADQVVTMQGMAQSNERVSEMLRNVLTLSETLTREIMVPRTDMICMDRTATLADMLRLCSRSGFSRVPVIGDDVDDLIGVAYLKDAVRATAFNPAASQRDVASIVRQPMLVPESKPVDDLFHAMQQTRQHVAIVVDEYGGIAGLVTIEDTIEQIVGELEDEHDRTQHSEPEKIGERKWKMPARTPIATLEEMFEIDIDEDDVDTVYGLLTKLLGRVPIVGSSAVTRGLRLTAVDTAGRRKRVSMIVVEPAAGSQGPAADDDEPRSDEQDGESASPQGK